MPFLINIYIRAYTHDACIRVTCACACTNTYSAYTDDHPHTCKTPALAEVPRFKQKIYTFQNVKKSHIYETVYQKLRNRLPKSTKPFT